MFVCWGLLAQSEQGQLRLEGWGSIPVRDRNNSPRHFHHFGPGAYAVMSNGDLETSLWLFEQLERDTDHSSCSVEIRNEWSYTIIPHTPSFCGTYLGTYINW
jgi:hypothetical protein